MVALWRFPTKKMSGVDYVRLVVNSSGTHYRDNGSKGVSARRFNPLKKTCLLLAALFSIPVSAQQFCAPYSAIDGVPFFLGQSYYDLFNQPPQTVGQIYQITQLESLNTNNCNSADPSVALGSCEWNNNAQTILDFLTSAQSIEANGALSSNIDFVSALYALLLRRPPDSAGLNYYISQLDGGMSRLNVVSAFLLSTEYRRRFACTMNGQTAPLCNGGTSVDSIPSFVAQSYLDILNRPPDGAGQEWWTSYTTTNQQAMCRNTSASAHSVCDRVLEAQTSLSFFNSAEYAQSNPPISSNAAFLNALYTHLLRRPPDQSGFQFYTNYLDQTGDRTGTIEAFLTSNEYRQRFACYAGSSTHLNFGINGHPFSHVEYSNSNGVSYATQMALAQSANLSWYRADTYVSASDADFTNLDLLLSAAQADGIQLLPTIIPIVNRQTDTLDQLYSESYSAAFAIVNRYKSSIHVWELSNEEDVQSLYEPGDPWGTGTWPYGPPPGDNLSDYYPPQLAISEAILHGLADGARAADPNCVRIVNFAWIHTGFIEHLEDDAIPYDIVGIHWYSNQDAAKNTGMGDLTCPGQDLPCSQPLMHFNLFQRLHILTNGKPLWMTETNYQPMAANSISTDIAWEENYLPPALQLYLGSPSSYPLQVVIIYELLDEPSLDSGGPFFAQMGVYEDTLNSDGTVTLGSPKPAYLSVQQLLVP